MEQAMKLHSLSSYVRFISLKLPHSCIDCLYQLGLINDSDLKAVVLRIFTGYLAVCRHLQRIYMLEPAGSHGVWSLDDYQMLVFYFGGCQLHGNPLYSPDCICDRGLMVEQASEYMYFEAIHFINTVRQYYFIKLIIQKMSDSSSQREIFYHLFI